MYSELWSRVHHCLSFKCRSLFSSSNGGTYKSKNWTINILNLNYLSGTQLPGLSFILQNSKLDRFSLLRNLPSAVNFAKLNISKGKTLLICCHSGKDFYLPSYVEKLHSWTGYIKLIIFLLFSVALIWILYYIAFFHRFLVLSVFLLQLLVCTIGTPVNDRDMKNELDFLFSIFILLPWENAS